MLITEYWFKILYELPTEYENYKTSLRGIIFKILLISLKRLTNSFPEVFFFSDIKQQRCFLDRRCLLYVFFIATSYIGKENPLKN